MQQDNHERREVLGLMKEVIQTGQYSYENPFGADITETLLDEFGHEESYLRSSSSLDVPARPRI